MTMIVGQSNNGKAMKRNAMKESWVLIKHCGFTKADALRQGWLIARAQHYMKTRKYCYFEFLKTDGKTYRKAFGTINPHFTPPTKGARTTPPTQQVFFDMEKKEWRSFRKSNLVRILM